MNNKVHILESEKEQLIELYKQTYPDYFAYIKELNNSLSTKEQTNIYILVCEGGTDVNP